MAWAGDADVVAESLLYLESLLVERLEMRSHDSSRSIVWPEKRSGSGRWRWSNIEKDYRGKLKEKMGKTRLMPVLK